MDIEGAKGILFNITGGTDLAMFEVDEAARIITEAADPDATVIFGSVINENYTGEVKITVVATGFDEEAKKRKMQQNIRDKNSAETNDQSDNGFRPSTSPTNLNESSENELDIPAFIRRKMQ
jgi:cell division protein FtsZ